MLNWPPLKWFIAKHHQGKVQTLDWTGVMLPSVVRQHLFSILICEYAKHVSVWLYNAFRKIIH